MEEPIENTGTPEVSEPTPNAEIDTQPIETPATGASEQTPAPAQSTPKSLLDDEDEPKADETKAENEAPTDEKIAEYMSGIPALDLGDGVKWDDATLKAITPSLMEMTGGDPKKAHGLIGAYTAHMQSVAKAQEEAANAFNNGLIKECETRFGADLKKVASFAKKGGAAVFGDKMWGELKRIPAFANNPDIMERLAKFGMKVADDNGKVIPREGEGEDVPDLYNRMYNNLKR